MTGAIACVLLGGLFIGIALRKRLFIRLLGRTLAVQYQFERRRREGSRRDVTYSEESFITWARGALILSGGLIVAVGLLGLIARH